MWFVLNYATIKTMKKLIIATRESQLALTQARLIKKLLQRNHPQLVVELLGITTKGDRVLDRPLADIGGKGLFIKELQQALLNGDADLAVHSAKDVPVENVAGLSFVAYCQRQDPRDVLLSKKYSSLAKLPKGAVVGSSSCRRRAQLLSLRPDLTIKDLRGNVDTRIKKLIAGEYDAIVLAAAGLIRLGLTEHITEYFDTRKMLPSVAQGALILEARSNDSETVSLLKALNQTAVAQQVQAERAFTKTLEGNCHSPIGVNAEHINGQLVLDGLVASLDGKKIIRAKKIATPSEAEALGHELAQQLLKFGADKILKEW